MKIVVYEDRGNKGPTEGARSAPPRAAPARHQPAEGDVAPRTGGRPNLPRIPSDEAVIAPAVQPTSIPRRSGERARPTDQAGERRVRFQGETPQQRARADADDPDQAASLPGRAFVRDSALYGNRGHLTNMFSKKAQQIGSVDLHQRYSQNWCMA